jgi:diacylglycerol kinase (ATP)
MSTNSVIDRFRNSKPCKVIVFCSPKAGSGASREQIPRLQTLLENFGVDCAVTHSVDDLQQQIASSAETHDTVVVAAGGDGTISLAASALQATVGGPDVPLVPMPLGTENLLARQFGHSAVAESVVRSIRHGSSYRLDAGAINEHLFLIMATCGFDAEVVRGMHLTRRGHIRRLSYLGPILRAIWKYKFPTISIRIDGNEPLECCWAMVFNLPRYGGHLRIEPDAVGNDGLLDVIAFKRGSIPSGLKYVAGIWLGGHHRYRDVVRCRGSSIEITSCQRVPFQLDGDYAGRLPLSIRTIPGSVHLLLPEQSHD